MPHPGSAPSAFVTNRPPEAGGRILATGLLDDAGVPQLGGGLRHGPFPTPWGWCLSWPLPVCEESRPSPRNREKRADTRDFARKTSEMRAPPARGERPTLDYFTVTRGGEATGPR